MSHLPIPMSPLAAFGWDGGLLHKGRCPPQRTKENVWDYLSLSPAHFCLAQLGKSEPRICETIALTPTHPRLNGNGHLLDWPSPKVLVRILSPCRDDLMLCIHRSSPSLKW